MKALRPHDYFLIVLPVHTETMKTTKTLSTFYCAYVEDVIEIYGHKRSTVNSQSSLIGARYQLKTTTLSVDILHLGFSKWKWTGTESTWRIVFKSFAFSVNSTRPHEADTVAFSNLSTLESVFKSLHFQTKMHSCGRGLNNLRWVGSRLHGTWRQDKDQTTQGHVPLKWSH